MNPLATLIGQTDEYRIEVARQMGLHADMQIPAERLVALISPGDEQPVVIPDLPVPTGLGWVDELNATRLLQTFVTACCERMEKIREIVRCACGLGGPIPAEVEEVQHLWMAASMKMRRELLS